MLLTITTTHRPATDLGFLLHKHPDKVHERKLAFGKAYGFYPEADEARCRFALVLDVDPVALVRGRGGPGGGRGGRGGDGGGLLTQYVNDRPYAASSFLSVAIARVLGTALSGRSKGRQALADTAIPLSAQITPLPCRGEGDLLPRLFEPLGYRVEQQEHLLDDANPDWGAGPYATVTIAGECRVSELLNHLYVLVPVLDNQKHYWVGDDEVDKLLAKGEGWLAHHPEKELIARRYLRHRRSLAREALARLADTDAAEDPDEAAKQEEREEELEKPIRLNDLRLVAVTEALAEAGARRVIDLGCGEGRLLRALVKDRRFEEVLGVDVSPVALERARDRLRLDRMPARRRERIRVIQGALTYRDERLAGYDAAAVVEVIEHIDPPRLDAFERALFAEARPRTVVVTTPNREYNAKFEDMAEGALRHRDHRFEWTRAEFRAWADGVAGRHGYDVAYSPIGEEDAELGAPTQMAVFRR